MIKLKLILEGRYENGKEFECVSNYGKVWRAIFSPAISNSNDNPNSWPFRVTLFHLYKGKYIPEDHFYLADSNDNLITSNLEKYELGSWKKIR